MKIVRKTMIQALCILTWSAVLSLEVNLWRPNGLPLVQAAQSSVKLDQADGEITLKDAAMLFVTKRAVFLDARSQYEFTQGHIQGSLSLPPSEFPVLIKSVKPRLEGKEAIITYCDGERCPLSHELAAQLRAAGFKNVWVLKNGWTLWNNEKLPVEKGQAKAFFKVRSEALCTNCGN